MMSAAEMFQAGNMLALAGWVVLIFLPRRWRIAWIPRFIIPGVLSLAYAPLILPAFFGGGGEGGYDTIAAVRALFANDNALVAGWLHYLAFDLFIGGWIAVEADRAGISRILQAPILLATFMFGPIGLILFFLTRGLSAGLVARRERAQ